MKGTILILIFAFAYTFITAQKTERYEGVYSNDQHEAATANYSFYRDAKTRKEVKHGSFRYIVRIKSPEKRLYRNISGTYKDGWKNGVWNYSFSTKDYNTNNDGYFYTYSIVLEANYDNGWPEGEWNYTAFIKRRNSVRSNGRTKWGAYEIVENTRLRLNYKRGVLVDSLWIKGVDRSIAAFMDKSSFLQGQFLLSKKGRTINTTFKDGFAITKTENKEATIIVNPAYDYYKKNKSNLNMAGARLDTSSIDLYKEELNMTVFNPEYFNYKYIDGDRTISFVGSRKKMKVVHKGMYTRNLSVYISPEEQNTIQYVYGFYNKVKQQASKCRTNYKNSNSDIQLRKKMDQLNAMEAKFKAYTCQLRVYKSTLIPKEIANKSSHCGSDIIINEGNTRIQILNTIYNKAKALDTKSKSIKCN